MTDDSTTSFQLFDALDSATESALIESIERFGVLVPVVTDQHGTIIDGHHRSAIADKLGVKYRTDVVRVADDDEARDIACTLNAARRHMSVKQRREVVTALREKGHSIRAIAGAVGISKSQVQNDVDELSTTGQLTQPDRVRGQDGKSRPARKPTIVPAKNDREAEKAQAALIELDDAAPAKVVDVKRVERLAREKKADERRAEPVEPVQALDVDLRVGEFQSALDDLAGQVDAIITDPPYPAEFVHLFSDLSEHAARLLKPNGVMIAMVGQSHLPAYIERLSEHLDYRWTGCYHVQGPRNRIHHRKVATGWKPLLIFQPPGANPEFLLDDTFTSEADDKEHHHWGQSESGMSAIVERLTEPGDLIVDPFLGGGTTAVVSHDMGRRFIGCDIDAAAVHAARDRFS